MWMGQQCPSDGGPLLFSLGKIVGFSSELIPDPHILCQPGSALLGRVIQRQGTGDPVGVYNVVKDGQVVEQFKILKHESDGRDAEISPTGVAQRIDIDIADTNRAIARCYSTSDQVQQGGFA